MTSKKFVDWWAQQNELGRCFLPFPLKNEDFSEIISLSNVDNIPSIAAAMFAAHVIQIQDQSAKNYELKGFIPNILKDRFENKSMVLAYGRSRCSALVFSNDNFPMLPFITKSDKRKEHEPFFKELNPTVQAWFNTTKNFLDLKQLCAVDYLRFCSLFNPFRRNVNPQESFETYFSDSRSIEDKNEIEELVKKYPVDECDFSYIPTGNETRICEECVRAIPPPNSDEISLPNPCAK
jgi:hypothetical protein